MDATIFRTLIYLLIHHMKQFPIARNTTAWPQPLPPPPQMPTLPWHYTLPATSTPPGWSPLTLLGLSALHQTAVTAVTCTDALCSPLRHPYCFKVHECPCTHSSDTLLLSIPWFLTKFKAVKQQAERTVGRLIPYFLKKYLRCFQHRALRNILITDHKYLIKDKLVT